MEKRTILQGEVYVCELDGIDSEQKGEKLCIVLQLDIINRTSPNVIIVPITSKIKKDMPTHLTFTQKKYPFFRYKYNIRKRKNHYTIFWKINRIDRSIRYEKQF